MARSQYISSCGRYASRFSVNANTAASEIATQHEPLRLLKSQAPFILRARFSYAFALSSLADERVAFRRESTNMPHFEDE